MDCGKEEKVFTIGDLVNSDEPMKEFWTDFNERQQKAYSDMQKRHMEIECSLRNKVEL